MNQQEDLTLSGPQEEHQAFWSQLTFLVDVEPPESVYRVLGRNHYIINAPAESTENAALRALQDAVALYMVDYNRRFLSEHYGSSKAEARSNTLLLRGIPRP